MVVLTVSNVNKSFGAEELFSSVTFSVNDTDRMAEHLAHTQDRECNQSIRDSAGSKCSIIHSSVCISEGGSFLVWDVRTHS